MATIYYKIFKHHKKADGTYNVKLCLTHKGKQVYHSTSLYATASELKKDFSLRQGFLFDKVYELEKTYRNRVSEMGTAIEAMEAKEILQHITTERKTDKVDFVAFSRSHIKQMKDQGRLGTVRSLQPALNNLIDFMRSDNMPIDDITANTLRGLERYLAGERKQVRTDQFGEARTRIVPGMSRAGIHATMRDIRILFNAARAHYNTEFNKVIHHYPFEHYKLPVAPVSRKRGGDMDIDDVKSLRDHKFRPGSRAELARDIFMLSFYLCGMNAKDIYDQQWMIRDGRLGYERSKTRGKRRDEAFISVKIPDEATPLLEQYNSKYLHRRYSDYGNFIKAIGKGFESMPAGVVIDGITFYHARHTFATLAHNKCGMSKEDIGAALNHVDKSRIVTERYIATDWSAVDRVQEAVLGLLKKHGKNA